MSSGATKPGIPAPRSTECRQGQAGGVLPCRGPTRGQDLVCDVMTAVMVDVVVVVVVVGIMVRVGDADRVLSGGFEMGWMPEGWR